MMSNLSGKQLAAKLGKEKKILASFDWSFFFPFSA